MEGFSLVVSFPNPPLVSLYMTFALTHRSPKRPGREWRASASSCFHLVLPLVGLYDLCWYHRPPKGAGREWRASVSSRRPVVPLLVCF